MRGPRLAAVVLVLLAAGCAPTYPIAPAPIPAPAPASALQGEPPPARPAPVPPPLRSSLPRPQVSEKDQCGATELQGLVGRPRSEIPVPLDPNRQRVACRGCPITDDYDPGRLNFFFDAESGLIREIRCG